MSHDNTDYPDPSEYVHCEALVIPPVFLFTRKFSLLTRLETPAVSDLVSMFSIIIFEKRYFKLSKTLSTFAIKINSKIVQNSQNA